MNEIIGPTIMHAGPASEVPQEAPAAAQATASPPPPKAAAQSTSSQVLEIVDADGRRLGLRPELTFLQEMDLKALAGNERAQNMEWFTMVMLCARVETIDGVRVPFPASEPTLRAMLQRVGRGGAMALISRFSPPADGGVDDEEVEAKN